MGRGGNRKKGRGGGEPSATTEIPPGAREMAQRVKEVVDRPLSEIYAVLEECNMDPNDAIERLRYQDTFQVVKSKRTKKKEKKESLELRSGRASGSSNDGDGDNVDGDGDNREGDNIDGDGDNIDSGECSISMQMSSSDYGVMHSELVQEKDEEMNAIPTSSILGSDMAVNYSCQRVTPQRFSIAEVPETSQSNSDFINTSRSTGRADYFSLFSRPPWDFFQYGWSGVSRRPSMADVVRMGRPRRMASSTRLVATDTYQLFKSCDAVGPSTSRNNSRLCQNMFLPVEPNQRHVYGHHEAEDVSLELSLAAANLQQLNLHEELSRITGPFTGAFVSRPLESNLAVASVVGSNMPSTGQRDTRIPKYHYDEWIGSSLDDSISPITRLSTDNYDMLSTSQPDVIRNDTFDALHTIQQNFPSASGYAFSNIAQQTAVAYTSGQANSYLPFSSAMALRPDISIFADSTITHLPTLPPSYSRPKLPPIGHGHRPNTAGRPSPPRNFFYLRSAAVQQAYSESNDAPQQPPAMLQCASTRYTIPEEARSYDGGFGNAADIPRNYAGTPSTFPARMEVRREEHLGPPSPPENPSLLPQLGEDASMWHHGAGTRRVTAPPTSSEFISWWLARRGGVLERHQPFHFDTSVYPDVQGSQPEFSEEHQ